MLKLRTEGILKIRWTSRKKGGQPLNIFCSDSNCPFSGPNFLKIFCSQLSYTSCSRSNIRTIYYFLFQFEYQQAQLEAEIENLSWKIEHAETTDRGDLENQMDIAEKRRYKSLNIFFPFLITHFQVQISERFSFFRTGLLRDFLNKQNANLSKIVVCIHAENLGRIMDRSSVIMIS